MTTAICQHGIDRIRERCAECDANAPKFDVTPAYAIRSALQHMAECGTWNAPTMKRVMEIIFPILDKLQATPALAESAMGTDGIIAGFRDAAGDGREKQRKEGEANSGTSNETGIPRQDTTKPLTTDVLAEASPIPSPVVSEAAVADVAQAILDAHNRFDKCSSCRVVSLDEHWRKLYIDCAKSALLAAAPHMRSSAESELVRAERQINAMQIDTASPGPLFGSGFYTAKQHALKIIAALRNAEGEKG